MPTTRPTIKTDHRGKRLTRHSCALCKQCWIFDWGVCIYEGPYTAFIKDDDYYEQFPGLGGTDPVRQTTGQCQRAVVEDTDQSPSKQPLAASEPLPVDVPDDHSGAELAGAD